MDIIFVTVVGCIRQYFIGPEVVFFIIISRLCGPSYYYTKSLYMNFILYKLYKLSLWVLFCNEM